MSRILRPGSGGRAASAPQQRADVVEELRGVGARMGCDLVIIHGGNDVTRSGRCVVALSIAFRSVRRRMAHHWRFGRRRAVDTVTWWWTRPTSATARDSRLTMSARGVRHATELNGRRTSRDLKRLCTAQEATHDLTWFSVQDVRGARDRTCWVFQRAAKRCLLFDPKSER